MRSFVLWASILFGASFAFGDPASPALRLEITVSPEVVRTFGSKFRQYLYSNEGRKLIRQTVLNGNKPSFDGMDENDVKRLFEGYRQWVRSETDIDPDSVDKTAPPVDVFLYYPKEDLQGQIRSAINDVVCIVSSQLPRGFKKRVSRRWCQGRGLFYGVFDNAVWDKIASQGPEILRATNADLARTVQSLNRPGSIQLVPQNRAQRNYAEKNGSYAKLVAPATRTGHADAVVLELSALDKNASNLADEILAKVNERKTGPRLRVPAQRMVGGTSRLVVVAGGFSSCLEGGQDPLQPNQSPGAVHPEATGLARQFIERSSHRAGDTILFSCFDFSLSATTLRYRLADVDPNGNVVLRAGAPAVVRFRTEGNQLEPGNALADLQSLIGRESKHRKVDLLGHSFGGGLVTHLARHLDLDVNLGTLATVDPISFFHCRPDAVADRELGSVLAMGEHFIGKSPGLRRSLQATMDKVRPKDPVPPESVEGCLTFLPEHDEAAQREIGGRLADRWFNAYQTLSPALHSGPVPAISEKILNQKVADLKAGNPKNKIASVSPHAEITESGQLWGALNPLLSGKETKTLAAAPAGAPARTSTHR